MTDAEKERRQAKRYKYSTKARFLLRGECESVGTLLDVSEGGLALLTDQNAEEGDDVVVYPEGLGRLTGKVVRRFHGGFGIEFSHSDAQRGIIRKKILLALKGAPYMRLGERRQGVRVKYNIDTVISIEGSGNPVPCTIVDMSQSGCMVKCDAKPPVGVRVRVGMLKGRISRYDEEGFAVEFQSHGAAADNRDQNGFVPSKKIGQG